MVGFLKPKELFFFGEEVVNCRSRKVYVYIYIFFLFWWGGGLGCLKLWDIQVMKCQHLCFLSCWFQNSPENLWGKLQGMQDTREKLWGYSCDGNLPKKPCFFWGTGSRHRSRPLKKWRLEHKNHPVLKRKIMWTKHLCDFRFPPQIFRGVMSKLVLQHCFCWKWLRLR